jgi:Amt family ammonium transporter
MQTEIAIASLLAWLGLLAYRIGVSRSKNSVSTATRAVCGLIVATLTFWAVGEALLFQHSNSVIGLRYELLIGWNAPPATLVFPLAALALAAGIAEASLTERGTFFAAMLSAAAIALAIVPIGWFWAWYGWLHDLGFIDDAGACWLHLSAAMWGAIGAWMLGSRSGKHNKDGSVNAIPGHNIPLAAIGIGTMFIGQLFVVGAATLVGGFPENVGDKIGSTILAAAGGWAVDDPTGGISLHGIAGAWGTLATGILSAGSIGQRLHALGIQALGIAAIGGGTAAVAFLTFAMLRATGRLRVREADEVEGLDLADHDIAAYPDFQQNTIRSYHLREA